VSVALIDANVVVRLLTNDIPRRAEAARELLYEAERGNIGLRMTALAFAEIVWVLDRLYGLHKRKIAEAMAMVLGLTGLTVDDAPVLGAALSMHADLNVDFIDAYQGCHAIAHGIQSIYSFDRHLDRIPGVVRVEP